MRNADKNRRKVTESNLKKATRIKREKTNYARRVKLYSVRRPIMRKLCSSIIASFQFRPILHVRFTVYRTTEQRVYATDAQATKRNHTGQYEGVLLHSSPLLKALRLNNFSIFAQLYGKAVLSDASVVNCK